jgi:hypothetical protein
MGALNITGVPEATREKLAKRARRQGSSLEEYLRCALSERAHKPTLDEWLDDVRRAVKRSGTHLTVAQILEFRDADRR